MLIGVPVFRIVVRGVFSEAILKEFASYDPIPGGVFVARDVQEGPPGRRVDLGYFSVTEKGLRSILPRLRELVRADATEPPPSFQVCGDVIDFRDTDDVIIDGVTRLAAEPEDLPGFSPGGDVLGAVRVRVPAAQQKMAAETGEAYPETGPHRRMVCT